ncbi:hypothetical protein [Streptomyces sp. NPDC093598]|uniref:hypothetical protein n=1 Tax=Streptomyces sp. NPDC093598 TaxID=3366046 RepID=UPI0037F89F64
MTGPLIPTRRRANGLYGPYREACTTTGTHLDSSGLYKMGGRFTQPDPFGKESNPCAYAAGDPPTASTPAAGRLHEAL